LTSKFQLKFLSKQILFRGLKSIYKLGVKIEVIGTQPLKINDRELKARSLIHRAVFSQQLNEHELKF